MEIRAGGGLWTWKSGQEGGFSGPGNPGGRGGKKIMPSVGGVWIFSGITQLMHIFILYIITSENPPGEVLIKYMYAHVCM